MSRLLRLCAPAVFLVAVLGGSSAFAGTQDFTIINKTGVEIYSLYVGESSSEDWEEDVLGEDTLPNGSRLNITFSGRKACLWDILVTDSDDENLAWTGINLCEVSVVVLKCGKGECWAEYE